MSFTIANWSCVSTSLSQGQELVAGVILNSPNLHTYASPTDTSGTILAANYFLPIYTNLSVGDFIVASGTDESFIARVTAVSVTSVTIVNTFSSQGGLVWNVNTTSPVQMATNNGYISNSVSLITYTLPSVAGTNPGDIIRVVGFESGGWEIAQNAAQTIHFGLDNSSSGVTGFIASTSQHDSVELVALSGNDWILTSSIGNITFN